MLDFFAGAIIMDRCGTYHFACEVNFGHRFVDLELFIACAKPVCGPERCFSVRVVRITHHQIMMGCLLTLGNRWIHEVQHR